MSALSVVERIHRRLMAQFTWVADQQQYHVREHWADHYQAFSAGEHIYDDCDGFTLTAAMIAINDYQIDPAEVSLHLCLTEVGRRLDKPPAYDHIVCVIGHYVVDNRLRRVLTKFQTGYVWERFMRLDSIGVWRQ